MKDLSRIGRTKFVVMLERVGLCHSLSNRRHRTSRNKGQVRSFAPVRWNAHHIFESESPRSVAVISTIIQNDSGRIKMLLVFVFDVLAAFNSCVGWLRLVIGNSPSVADLHRTRYAILVAQNLYAPRRDTPSVCGTERYFITHPPGIILLACSPNDGYKESLYIILRLANKIKRFSAKFIKYFQNRITGVWVLPTRQNERDGSYAETLIFAVCTDTGCACYSLKSHIRRYAALSFLKKPRAHFLLKLSCIAGQTPKKCPL